MVYLHNTVNNYNSYHIYAEYKEATLKTNLSHNTQTAALKALRLGINLSPQDITHTLVSMMDTQWAINTDGHLSSIDQAHNTLSRYPLQFFLL